MTYVLDASSLLALIQEEKGADIVAKTFNNKAQPPLIHAINLLEIEYKLRRKHPEKYIKATMKWLKETPITVAEVLTHQITDYARYLKSNYHLSLADSIGLGLAKFMDIPFLTADHHELDIIAQKENVKIEFIR